MDTKFVIWDYFSISPGEDKIATCNQCCKDFSYRTSVTNLKSHLKAKHVEQYNSYISEFQTTRPRHRSPHTVQLVSIANPLRPKINTDEHFNDESSETGPTYAEENIPTYSKITDTLEAEQDDQMDNVLIKIVNPVSNIWEYFTKVPKKGKFATCGLCFKDLSYKTSITNLKTHLKLKHNQQYKMLSTESETHFTQEEQNIKPMSSNQCIVSDMEFIECTHKDNLEGAYIVSKTVDKIETQKNRASHKSIKKYFNSEEKKQLHSILLKLLARTYLPISIVENQNFKEFVEALNPYYVLPTRKMVSERFIPFLYNRCLDVLKNTLHQEAGTVCLTMDSWSSTRDDSFICITAHYMNNEFKFKSLVLKCSKVHNEYTSENIASIISQTTTEWGIYDKINMCVTDNSSNIVGAINILDWKHCGCIANKLNLTIQHALSLFDETLTKIRDIISYYHSNPKAKEKLLGHQTKIHSSTHPRDLKNFGTRWNSIYAMIERFVNLEDSLMATIPFLEDDLPILTVEEWTALKQLYKVLKPFYIATTELCMDKYVRASKAIAVINGLKDVLEEIKKKHNYYNAVKNIIECIEFQLNTEFQDLEYEEDLTLSMVLDPRYKMAMFIDEYAADKAKNYLVTEVQKLLKEEMAPMNSMIEPKSESDDSEVSLWRKRNLSMEKGRSNTIQNYLLLAQQQVETYIQDEFAQNNCDPCNWWRINQFKYPHLARLFKTKCNIVATSVPSEAVFSKAGYILTEKRAHLSAKKTEQLVFLNFNLKDGDYKIFMP